MGKAGLDLAVRQEEVRAAIAVGLRRIAGMQTDFADLVRAHLAGQRAGVSRYASLRPAVAWKDRHRFDGIYAKVNRHRRHMVFFANRALAQLRRSPDFRQGTDRTFVDLP